MKERRLATPPVVLNLEPDENYVDKGRKESTYARADEGRLALGQQLEDAAAAAALAPAAVPLLLLLAALLPVGLVPCTFDFQVRHCI